MNIPKWNLNECQARREVWCAHHDLFLRVSYCWFAGVFIGDFIPPPLLSNSWSRLESVMWNIASGSCCLGLLWTRMLACSVWRNMQGDGTGGKVRNMNSRNMRKLLASRELEEIWSDCDTSVHSFKDYLQLTASFQVYFNRSISQMLHRNICLSVLCSAPRWLTSFKQLIAGIPVALKCKFCIQS